MDEPTAYFFEVYGTLPRAGPGDDASTETAYRMMPGLPERPTILDIGCGPGKQTMVLARLSRGKVIALDNHQPFLDKVGADAQALGLAGHIETVNRDMNAMDFAPESFDVIWSEGALYQMGFENGLRACRPLLKKGGSIGLSELVWLTADRSAEARDWAKDYPAMKDVAGNLELFQNNGYEVTGHFTLPVSSWFENYYDPMQVRVDELRPKYQSNETALKVINEAQAEIDGFRRCSGELGYEFFVARRREP